MSSRQKSKKPTNSRKSVLLTRILPAICGPLLKAVRWSWRVRSVEGDADALRLIQAGTPVIYAVWHGRMYSLFKAVPMQQVAILVSPSTDGEFITRIARHVGFQHFVRGSHKRKGTQAILGLHKALGEEQRSIVFTVDGPRGPRYQVKPGVIRLASQTGVPIIPIGSSTRWLLRKFERSWDHFHAPLPGTDLDLLYGKPLYVPASASEEDMREAGKVLEAELMRVNLHADAAYGFHRQERL